MNTTGRRIATATVGAALSALAATGPAAHAAKPATTPEPLTISAQQFETAVYVTYTAPVAERAVRSVTCSVDAVPLASCGGLFANNPSTTTSWATGVANYNYAAGDHTFTVTVATKKATYTGSVSFTGTGA